MRRMAMVAAVVFGFGLTAQSTQAGWFGHGCEKSSCKEDGCEGRKCITLKLCVPKSECVKQMKHTWSCNTAGIRAPWDCDRLGCFKKCGGDDNYFHVARAPRDFWMLQ